MTVDQAIRWRRDLFGSRVPTQAKKIRALGQARKLRVRDVPTAGRPGSFAGAVGTGFTIDTPLKVARYGISSVVSLVDDVLIEDDAMVG